MRALIIGLLVFAALPAISAPWATPKEEERLFQDMQSFFQGAEKRYPGSAGNLAIEEKVARRFAATGFENGAIRFTAPSFLPGKTTLFMEGMEPANLFPMHPSLFRPGNFKEKEFTSRLVYLGRGTAEDLALVKGTNLEGAVALMDFTCGESWLRFLRFGVRGFIFIGENECERYDALVKVYTSEVAVPRFLVLPEQGQKLKSAALTSSPEVRIQAEPSLWENRTLRDLWVLIPGSDPDLAKEVCVITAPMDANCIVPELALGAQSGANLYLLMQLLDQFRKKPPARSLLLVAVNAHTQNFRGERMLAWYLLTEKVEQVRDVLHADRRREELLADYYSKLNLKKFTEEDENRLIAWRFLIDDSTGKNISVKESIVSLAKRDVNRLKIEQLQVLRQNLEKTALDVRNKALEEKRIKYVNVLKLFNKVKVRATKLGDLTEEEMEILRGYVRDVIAFNSKSAELNERDLLIDKQNGAIKDILKGRKVPFVICLNMDWGSDQMGFCSMNVGNRTQQWPFRFGANTTRIASELEPVQKGKTNLWVDSMTMKGGLMEKFYFSIGDHRIAQNSAVMYFQAARKTPAFSLRNVFTDYGKAFLPSDSIENLNRYNLAQAMKFIPVFLRAVLADRKLTTSSELGQAKIAFGSGDLMFLHAKTFKFDELAASVSPDIPVPGSVLILRYHYGGQPLECDAIISGDVVNGDTALTDERAAVIVYGTRGWAGAAGGFHFDKDFIDVDHVIDAGDIHKKRSADNLYGDRIIALFECREFPFYAMEDSSLIASGPIMIRGILPLLAKGNSSPRKFGLTGVGSGFTTKKVNATAGAPAAFYGKLDESIKFLTSQKRLALNATEKDYEGIGFRFPNELGFDLLARVVMDMSVLNRARVKKLRDVADELVHQFLQRGDQCLERMNALKAQNDYLSYLQALYEGIGSQVKSYQQAKQTADDMLKAVVVYMALLLPFCIFFQKLVFKFVKIEHEMAMFAFLFVLTFIVFRMIHPAFRIAQNAEAIFIAFIMGALGLFVISILRTRFEGEMQVMFRSYLGVTDDDVGYSTVTQKALLIGVNNMKRRRIRTMLTTATIVLIAFTMLSFTSISKKINPTIILKNKVVPYTGLLFHWPGRTCMDEATLTVFKNLFHKRAQMVVRRWLVPGSSAPIHVSSSLEKQARFEGILGLSKAEDGFLGPIPLIGGRYFSSDDAGELVLSASAADVLGIDPDKLENVTANVRGRELKVVGVYDDVEFRYLKDLNGIPILPITAIARERVGSFRHQAAKETAGAEIGEQGVLYYVDTGSLLVMPVGMAELMGARPRSISIKLKGTDPIWPEMDMLLTATRAKFYISSMLPFSAGVDEEKSIAAGVYYVGSNYSTSVGGLSALLIPLFIASTIILNTMLGSVYERKKEIAVFNAIGLNPHHIGMFFLAESFVYGVLGSVGGYLIGQVLSITLNQFGWAKDINLNYSSLSVAYVILFTIAIVLLSTLYPAIVATKSAVPSGKRKWSLPPHDGHEMRVVFPFIYHPRIAEGVLGYLREYFGRFSEASIGDLIATPEKHLQTKDAKGRNKYTMEYHTALAPYDLGVTQRLVFDLGYDEHVQAYCLEMQIVRVSGQDSNWVTTNRPFLERLRKYLMRWRNLDISQQGLYVQESKTFFSES